VGLSDDTNILTGSTYLECGISTFRAEELEVWGNLVRSIDKYIPEYTMSQSIKQITAVITSNLMLLELSK
jgi:hypothetical protein